MRELIIRSIYHRFRFFKVGDSIENMGVERLTRIRGVSQQNQVKTPKKYEECWDSTFIHRRNDITPLELLELLELPSTVGSIGRCLTDWVGPKCPYQ